MKQQVSSKVSLIAVFHNEEASLPPLFESILAQTRLPDEIIFVDDRSTDGTLRLLHEFRDRSTVPVTVVVLDESVPPGGNLIARGRNLAIAHSRYDLIACTDGGCVLDKSWLVNIVAPLEKDASADLVAGWRAPNPQNWFEETLATVAFRPSHEYRMLRMPSSSLPAAASLAIRKSAWRAVNGFPEGAHFGEDWIFFQRLHQAGHRFIFAESAVVYKRVSRNITDWFLKYYRYGRGDGLINRVPWAYAARFLSYVGGLVFLGLAFRAPIGWLGVVALIAFYLREPYLRFRWFVSPENSFVNRAKAVGLIPLLVVTGDVARMIGYVLGTIERVAGRDLFGHTVRYGV